MVEGQYFVFIRHELFSVCSNAMPKTVCPRSSYPFYKVTYYIRWITNSWTDGNICKS